MDLWRENGFESKRWINYYTELGADVLILGCTLLQYLQLMVIITAILSWRRFTYYILL